MTGWNLPLKKGPDRPESDFHGHAWSGNFCPKQKVLPAGKHPQTEKSVNMPETLFPLTLRKVPKWKWSRNEIDYKQFNQFSISEMYFVCFGFILSISD